VRTLSWNEIEDILAGATILGCGGGGELAEGRDYMRGVYDQGRAVTLAAPDELAGEALVACPYGVGAMTVGDESEYGGRPFTTEHPGVLALEALAAHLGREFSALICGELGGTSIADAFVPAALLGLPVVDADPVGRAVPEIEHSMYCVHGLPIAPQAVVNEIGDTVLITRVADDVRSEALVRALSIASRNLVWVADHALPWSLLRDVVVGGTIGLAERVGRAQREALAAGDAAGVAAAAAAAGGGLVVFGGTVASYEWRDAEGFTVGETVLHGAGEHAGSNYRLWFKNENLLSWRDGAPDVLAPDLVCLIDQATGAAATNPYVTVGSRVTVVAFPSAAQWRTATAIATLGPRHFGFDIDFVPVERRLAAAPPQGV
jgi:uncharacterized protein